MKKYTNALIHESSPYLLQHAHNPVNWLPWSDSAFAKAKAENKLVLVSVGYSACHWCHVMEHESFEDELVAELMNKHFVCIKVDREERPDVDQVYMTAVQLMTERAGWPLNCFTLPDGRPVYGGTYYPKEQWTTLLHTLQQTYLANPDRFLEYAEKLHNGIQNSELLVDPPTFTSFEASKVHELVQRWKRNFDLREGGNNGAPKFPLPSNLSFLLHYGVLYQDERIIQHLELTLDKMAMGGIYDQIGGGFARYSVDVLWKVPHFEKMLYDNAQLLAVYAKAFKYFKKPLYKHVVEQTFNWLEREMKSDTGAYFAALDADSEGEEGKFYVWTERELKTLLEEDYDWVKAYYSVSSRGLWEGNYILLRTEPDKTFAQSMGWTEEFLYEKIEEINATLLKNRNKRIPPGKDSKMITSWNALLVEGMCEAYAALGELKYLKAAQRIGNWLKKQWTPQGLKRVQRNADDAVLGFLDDYAHTTSAFIQLYRATFNEEYLTFAEQLLNYTQRNFQVDRSRLFYYTPKDTSLIARKMELNDNVIPSSNSVMARNLFYLGHLLDRPEWREDAQLMLMQVYDGMEHYGSGYSNWAELLLHHVRSFYTVALVGDRTENRRKQLELYYLPNALVVGGSGEELELLKDKKSSPEGTFSVCFEGTCLLPTETIGEVLLQLR